MAPNRYAAHVFMNRIDGLDVCSQPQLSISERPTGDLRWYCVIKGSCNCGAVTYTADVEATDVYVCHCSICRRFSGAQGMAVTVVENQSFRWTSDTDSIAVWDKPGHDWQANFCSVCGFAVPGRNDEARMFIPVGSIIEGGDRLTVVHHIYVDSKASWDTWDDDGQQHPEAFGSGEPGREL